MTKFTSTLLLASFLTLSGFALTGCGSREESETTTTVDTTTNIPADASVNAIEEVALDPEKLRQALVVAESKGNLQMALTEAAKDSIVRDRMRAALAASAPQRTAAKTSTSKRTTTTTSKDGFDKTEDALDKAGRTIDRTNDVINKAAEVNRKADELLRGGRR